MTRAIGGSLLLTGIMLGLTGVARDEDILSKSFLVCSPAERRVFADTVRYGGTGVEPEPNLSNGSCAASLDVQEGPGRLSTLLSERLGSQGWQVNKPSYEGSPDPLSSVLLTAKRGHFYVEARYYKHAGGHNRGAEARLNVALSKL